MCPKSFVFLIIGILFLSHMTQSLRPPKVPQIFPPTQPTFVQTQQPNEVPLTLQALYTGCPNPNSENCKKKLLNIVDFLLARETGERRKVDSFKILQAREMLKVNNKKLILDATKNAIEQILDRNYQVQAVSNNILKQSSPPVRRRPIPNRPRLSNRPNMVQSSPYGYNVNPSLTNVVQSQSGVQSSPYGYNVKPSLTNVVQSQNVVQSSPYGYNINPSLTNVVQSQNVNPVVPLTSITGQISDNDDVLVFYKPKVVSYNQVNGNVVRKLSKRVLVPYHVSKIY